MTKAETISNLKAYLDGDTAIGNIIPLRSVLESAIKYLEPSLPSNLDEAAEEYKQGEIDTYADYYDDTGEPLCFMEALKDAFKAGAGWMAGQGYTQEGIARPDDCEIWVNIKNTDIKDGDKVVVQIRKK